MRLNVTAKISIGFGLVALAMGVTTVLLSGLARDVSSQSAEIADRRVPALAALADMKFATVEMQQWLTDVGATGDPAGFEDATAAASQFAEALERYRRTEGTAAAAARAAALKKDFENLYSSGRRMADAYLAQGREAGNVIMEEFDQGSDTLAAAMDPIMTEATAAVAEHAEAIQAGSRTTMRWLYVTLAVSVLLAVAAAVFLSRNLAASLGAEPEALADMAARLAGGEFAAAKGLHPDREHGVFAAVVRMAHALEHSLAGAAEREAQAREAGRRAEASAAAAEAARREAEEARSQGLREAAGLIEDLVARLGGAVELLSGLVARVAGGAETQRLRSAEAATAMEEMAASVLEVAGNASRASQSAAQARNKAGDGAAVVKDVVAAIGRVDSESRGMQRELDDLGDKAQGIGRIMGVISDIADQTNLLALNAAIEAARAGDAGRGFAVVADEVRKLAEKTMTATREVGEAVTAIQAAAHDSQARMAGTGDSVAESTRLADAAGAALAAIVALAEASADEVRNIATASEEQSAAGEEINRAVLDVSRISDETSQGMADCRQAIAGIQDVSGALQTLMSRLRQG